MNVRDQPHFRFLSDRLGRFWLNEWKSNLILIRIPFKVQWKIKNFWRFSLEIILPFFSTSFSLLILEMILQKYKASWGLACFKFKTQLLQKGKNKPVWQKSRRVSSLGPIYPHRKQVHMSYQFEANQKIWKLFLVFRKVGKFRAFQDLV